MSIEIISPKQLHDLVQNGEKVDLIDVRTPVEFREVHVAFAHNVPLDKLDSAKVMRERANVTGPLYVICKSGARSKQACEKIVSAGCTRVINVEGGTSAWEQAGLTVVRGKKAISLERQVRIAAGALVLTGAGLSFVSHYWIGLSAFVGAGLMFAGITDTCAMGMILARMPWNQVPKSSTSNSPLAVNPATSDTGSCCR